MRGRRWILALLGAVLVVVVVVVVARVLADDPDGESTSPPVDLPFAIPNLGGTLSAPGAEMAPGYRVVEGSYLVGRAMPARSFTRDATAWTALAIVTGDPAEVLDGYAGQARQHGLSTSLDTYQLGPDRCAGLGDNPTAESCIVTMSADDTREAETLQLRYARGTVDGQPTSLLRIEHVGYADGYPSGPGIDLDLPPRPDLPSHLDLPESWPPLPRTGQALTPRLDNGPMRVVAGTTPASPAWRLGPDRCTQELAWMIRVDDGTDPRKAFAAYLEQAGGSIEDSEPYEITLADGTFVRYEPRTSVTVYDLDLTLVQPPDEPAWIHISHCYQG